MMVKNKVLWGGGFAILLLLILLFYFGYSDMLMKKQASGVFTQTLSTTVRPQDDFYTYANEKWLQKAIVNAHKPYQDNFTLLQSTVFTQIRDIVENESLANFLPPELQPTHKELILFYQKFLDKSTRNSQKFNGLLPEIEGIENLEGHQDIFAYFAKAQSLGVPSPIMVYPLADEMKPERKLLHLWQYGLGLHVKGYYFIQNKDFIELRKEYLAYMIAIFTALDSLHPEEDAKAALTIEMRLAQEQLDEKLLKNPSKLYHLYTPRQLKKKYKKLNWSGYLETFGIQKPTSLIINQPSYIKALQVLLTNLPLKDWKAYLKWQLLNTYAPYLHDEIAQLHRDFYQKSYFAHRGMHEAPELVALNQEMAYEIGEIYKVLHLDIEVQERVTSMLESIKIAMIKTLDKVSWLTPVTRQKAQKKLASVELIHAHMPEMADSENKEILLNRADDSLVLQVMQLNKRSLARSVNKIYQKQRIYPEFYAQDVQLSYHPELNAVICPIALLQEPIFHKSADDAVNYGALGTLLAHQMIRSFGLQGASYDKKGVLKSWWTEKDDTLFQKMRAPLLKQYAAYIPVDAIHIDAERTLDENTLDVLALNFSYEAFKSFIKGKHIYNIDDFSAYERFFLGYAQVMRRKETKQSLIDHVLFDRYAPAKFRVNGAVSQSSSFYRTYHIQQGDDLFLLEDEKVNLWP